MGKLRFAAIAPAALALTSLLAASPAAADDNSPWCAVVATDMGRTAQCAYHSRAQCRAAIGGVGSCQPNRSSHARGKAPDRRHRRH